MTTPTDRRRMTAEAEAKRQMALKAHREGMPSLRDSYLKQAADRYREAGQVGMAKWCERFILDPAAVA